MTDSLLTDQIEMLRVHLESSLVMPVVLVVSSARDEDGKSVVAWEIARGMEDAGHSTLLVLADESTAHADGGREPRTLEDISDFGFTPYVTTALRPGSNVLTLPNEKLRRTATRESVKRFAAACRSTYAVTVIEAADLLGDTFALLAGMAADGVLLSIRAGRRVRGEDRRLADTLARERLPFLGVVSVAAPVIKNERFGLPRRRVIDAGAPVAPVAARREQAV